MTIPVQQSLTRFIAIDADVSLTNTGVTQVRFTAGVERVRREQAGPFTKREHSLHELLIVGRSAERAAARFREGGDQFIAHGYVETRYAEAPALSAAREVYVARRIGHDLARTTYEVDRAPAGARQDPDRLEQATGAVNPLPADAQRGPITPPAGAPHATVPRSGTSTTRAIGA
ncbi:single-stranded DNA-binding protein [Georgenia muralis]